ncbi:cupredoxin domain-containing protein [Natronorubrum halophilum]|uniref:hypothetical protein n=1 Tax=Natronorubrum halophilum TaxID=1702106 RepID=UPI0010C1FFFF|nr:hypothetical protein [Natronorubrum halophilum]
MNWTRRRVVGATVAAAALAGCLGEDGGDTDGDEETSNDSNGDGNRDAETVLEDADLEDHTGKETVEITIDPDGGGFEPAAFEIDTDTLLRWHWEGSSTGLYPIDIPEECDWDEEDNEDDEWEAGDEYDRIFWADGSYLYASRDADDEEFTGAFRVRDSEDGEQDEDENGSGMGM